MGKLLKIMEKAMFSKLFLKFSTVYNILYYMLRKDASAEKTVNLHMIFQIIEFH